MENLEDVMLTLDSATNTERKRKLIGGILLSISMLFGGLAFTVMMIKNMEDDNE
jgi:hypothetical protein